MSKLEPGMLALVIGFSNFPDNVGKIVTTDRYAKTGDPGVGSAVYTGSGAWLVKGDNLVLNRGGRKVIGAFAFVNPDHLLPIRPEADPLDQKQQQELHA